MSLSNSSILTLVPIHIRKDIKNYIVEDALTGDFYEMPELCIEALELFQTALTLGEAGEILTRRYPTEEIDMIGFAQQLLDSNLVKEMDGTPITPLSAKKIRGQFNWISPALGKFFFNRISLFLYALIILINISIFIVHPNLLPKYNDLFIFHYMAINVTCWLVISSIALMFHELGHIAAMRSYGLQTRMGIGHRLFLIVLETDMTPSWKLPTKDRNVLYLAGLFFDSLLLFVALLFQLLQHNPSHGWTGFSRVVVFDVFIRLIYQCCVYMKTDLYFVFENVTGCYNLMENAGALIQKKLPFVIASDDETIYENEKKVILSYAIFFAIGVVVTVALYIIYYIPQMVHALINALSEIIQPITVYAFWDGMLFVLQLAISFGLLFYSWSKKYRPARFV